MNKELLAQRLQGIEYPVYRNLTCDLVETARRHGLVIVYGAGDDLMEFDGAITDEMGCYEGGTALVDRNGLLGQCHFHDSDEATISAFLARKSAARQIVAVWSGRKAPCWTYRTDIPLATFDVMADGRHYCRGVVFSLSDLDKKVPEGSQA